MTAQVGERAPDFTLHRTLQERVSLKDFVGKRTVVLLFYPLDWSPVCTKEMEAFREHTQALERSGAQVLGISVDSPFSHEAWAEKLGITFPLLSDYNREATRKYGVVHEDLAGLKGVAKRSVFVIDRRGIIRYRWVSEDPAKEPDYAAVQAAVKALG